MKKLILAIFFLFAALSSKSQTQPTKLQDIKLDDGKIITILSNGTWKEKKIIKPKIEWAIIPAGTFIMGTPTSDPDYKNNELFKYFEIQHKVTLSGFKMSKYEVTFEQYDLFCEATSREKPSDKGWGRGKHPVINVSFEDAKAFCDWMGCRLPTEAEWEYACRAGTTTKYNTGNILTTAMANLYSKVESEYREKTLPVGSFAPNNWGLYDMHGNVDEWCSDFQGDYTPNEQTNPQGPSYCDDPPSECAHPTRGGGWGSYAYQCGSSWRVFQNPPRHGDDLGFRLVSTK